MNAATFEVRSPATGEVVGAAPVSSPADVDRVVRAARAARPAWAELPASAREAAIRRATAAARAQAPAIGRLMALETGKPLNQSVAEVSASCDLIDVYAGEAFRVDARSVETEKPEFRAVVAYRPVGLVAMIVPWNYPVALLAWKLGPALATGCAAVVKPSPVASLCTIAFVDALMAGGLPEGLVATVSGEGTDVGEALLAHPGVDKVAMTGATSTGMAIMRAFGPTLRRVTLELGGHCPALVLPDADADRAAEVIAYKAFRNMGQSCSSINRIYAHRSVHDAVVAKTAALAAKLTIGDGITDGGVDLGPMATGAGRDKVAAHVADAVAKGARVVCGGAPPSGERFARGWFYQPTVVTGLTPEMIMSREETFGPVAPFAVYDDLEDAIRLANDTPYGLVSYVFTRDQPLAERIAARLEAGTVCINHGAVNTAFGPYQGWKDSGFGVELGREAVFEYLNLQHVKSRAG